MVEHHIKEFCKLVKPIEDWNHLMVCRKKVHRLGYGDQKVWTQKRLYCIKHNPLSSAIE